MAELQIINHNDILFRDLLRAVMVKNVAWPHPVESQVKWIIENMCPDDIHVFLKEDGDDKAYLTLSPVVATVNGIDTPFMGIGCVCSAYPGMGWGKRLLININDYLDRNNHKGLLFCKSGLVSFYESCKWHLISNEKVILDSSSPGIYTLEYNCPDINSFQYEGRLF